ncbi:MAG: hypothetical protein PHC95_01925 [Parabacteroides sp.]|nr:hypothetical protein [Parabacteroides sp.]
MNWIELKALNSLYHNEVVKVNETLANSSEVHFLINSLNILEKNSREIKSTSDFKEFYEHRYFDDYKKYTDFLTENKLLFPQTRFEESDIKKLIEIDELKKEGNLEELRQQIIASNETLRGVSLMFFKNEKYLDNKSSLIKALKKVLEVEQFANEKDQQYIYKLECHNPKLIVLCENLDFLKKPVKPREFGIELWYAGGKNVEKLKYADTRGLPIFYSCDWDYDGLFVIYPLVKEKIPAIELLIPNGLPKGIDETEHDSKWQLCNIKQLFSDEQQVQIIEKLIKNDQWIIEESNHLIEILKQYFFQF